LSRNCTKITTTAKTSPAFNRGHHLYSAGRQTRGTSVPHNSSFNLLLRYNQFIITIQYDRIRYITCAEKNWRLVCLIYRSEPKTEKKLECGPMPNVMAAQPNIGGALWESSVIPFLVSRYKVWLTVAARVTCSNAADIGERKTWTHSDFFAAGKILLGGKSPQKCIYTCIYTYKMCLIYRSEPKTEKTRTRMWANSQRDGRPAECRWRHLFNAANFGWRPLLECRAVTLPRRETRWNLLGCPKLANRSQRLVGRSSAYYEDMWGRHCCLTVFSDSRYVP